MKVGKKAKKRQKVCLCSLITPDNKSKVKKGLLSIGVQSFMTGTF